MPGRSAGSVPKPEGERDGPPDGPKKRARPPEGPSGMTHQTGLKGAAARTIKNLSRERGGESDESDERRRLP